MSTIQIIPIHGIDEVQPGADLAALLLHALASNTQQLEDGDVLVVTQKIVSKAEGRLVDPTTVEPSPFAHQLAAQGRKDAHYYEVILRESRRIVKMAQGVLITETHHGLVCANSGVDESNVDGGRMLCLLPKDPDASAARLAAALQQQSGASVALIISDTFGRPWRNGQVNVAIGCSGLAPLNDYTGQPDSHGYTMQASILAVADELASAAELVMGKVDRVPAAIVRGYRFTPSSTATSQLLLRDPRMDLFR
ncbi:coenzyme F420-0:L-glutamate ligase [Candidatus Viridilinea mediisalina]|uniref:Coenzyme F420-0:L-glutamate ligase n=1 Tax=Candidatus Viridilinea mediisalina TaxID=2024553 RepID=A0A2A6RN82_9CHLR|nr:coenzyme F420-0:L-glutamate ligase [Candidatus Viridilinea mediisalina]PDW04522.1 coenzyme F420-0:L-glutamate ligase [Candidatus Viridilinea mediisalina]